MAAVTDDITLREFAYHMLVSVKAIVQAINKDPYAQNAVHLLEDSIDFMFESDE
jgi:hypothetical protein